MPVHPKGKTRCASRGQGPKLPIGNRLGPALDASQTGSIEIDLILLKSSLNISERPPPFATQAADLSPA